MKAFFNMDGPVFQALSKLADLLILNLLFVVCSLPVFTIGASLTAMAYVCMKLREDTGYVWRSFFKSFKRNFKQATVIWLIMAAILVILIADILIMRSYGGGVINSVMFIMTMAALILWVMYLYCVFPILAKFDNTIKATLSNCLLIMMANAPRLILMVVITVAAVVITLLNSTTLSWGLLYWPALGFAVLAYIDSYLMDPIIQKLLPPEADEGGETPDPDPVEALTSADAPETLPGTADDTREDVQENEGTPRADAADEGNYYFKDGRMVRRDPGEE